MTLPDTTTTPGHGAPSSDSPKARRYNRIRRWLGITDAVIGFLLLIVLLVTGWTGTLRDWSYRMGGQHYF